MPRLPIALQMYTLRDAVAEDFPGTLARVADIGYTHVELAGYGGFTARDLKQGLTNLGLKVAGSHVGLNVLEGDLSRVIDYNREIGNRYIVCPSLPAERRQNADGYRQIADALNRAGATLKEAGLQLAYHNHAFEFERMEGGAYAYDILLGAADPDLVKIELDTYWVKKGGEEPAEYMRKYAGRIPLIHLKDMTPGDNPTFAEVGEGTMDLAAIFEATEAAGGEYYIVEQDVCQRPPLESVRISYENLQKMGIA